MGPTGLVKRLADINYTLSWSAHKDRPSWGGYFWTRLAGETMGLHVIRQAFLIENAEPSQELSLQLNQLNINILSHYDPTKERKDLLDAINKLMHPPKPPAKESTPLNAEVCQAEPTLPTIGISWEDEKIIIEDEPCEEPTQTFTDPIAIMPPLEKNLKFLSLHSWLIERFPGQILDLKQLQLLLFGFHERKPLNLQIRSGDLIRLRCLLLRNCFMLKIPVELAYLPSLTSLYFVSSEILKIDLTPFTRIKQLAFYGTPLPLGILPLTIIHLQDLTELTCTKCCLNNLPNIIGELTTLQKLDITRNPYLEKLPETLGQLTQLKELRCDPEHLSLLPSSLANCKALENIFLTDGTNAWSNNSKITLEDLLATPSSILNK